ncbi:autotransporter-associated beta strand repeat-containing protein, partial [Martelella sp. FLE1502]
MGDIMGVSKGFHHSVDRVHQSGAERSAAGKRLSRFLAGTAFSGVVLLGASGVYLSGSSEAWAVACQPDVVGSTTYTFDDPGPCELTLPFVTYNGQNYTVTIDDGAQVTTNGGNLYIGSPGAAGGAPGGGNMSLTVTNQSTSLTVGGGADTFVGYTNSSGYPVGSGYLHVTNKARAIFGDLLLLSGTGGSNGSILFDDSAEVDIDQFVVSNSQTAVISSSGTNVTVETLFLGDTGSYGPFSTQLASVIVKDGARLHLGSSTSRINGNLVIGGNSEFVASDSLTVGDENQSGAIWIGSADPGNPAGQNFSVSIGQVWLIAQPGHTAKLVFNHVSTASNPFVTSLNLKQTSSAFDPNNAVVQMNGFTTLKPLAQQTAPQIQVRGGTLNLLPYDSFNHNNYSGQILVQGGTLSGDDMIIGNLNYDGATLEITGGTLSPGDLSANPGGANYGTLTSWLPVTFGSGGTFHTEIGGSSTSGNNDLFIVSSYSGGSGSIALAGTLTVQFNGTYNERYTLIDVQGTSTGSFGTVTITDLTDGGRTLLPNEYELSYNNNTDVTLIVYGAVTGPLTYWNGGTGGNQAVAGGQGGGGVWNTSYNNWTNAAGSGLSPWTQGESPIFGGNGGGAVTLASNVRVGGIEFARDGYVIASNNSSTISLDSTDGPVVIETGANMTATIDVALKQTYSDTRLIVEGGGTLVLTSENNDYTGETEIRSGVLQLGDATHGNGGVRGKITGSGGLSIFTSSSVDFGNDINDFGGGIGFYGPSSGQGVINFTGNNDLRAATTDANVYNHAVLNMLGSLPGELTVGEGGTLAGTGSVTTVKFDTGTAVFSPGDYRQGTGALGTFNAEVFQLDYGHIVMDVTASGQDKLIVDNEFYGVGSILINFSGETDTPYTLITYGSTPPSKQLSFANGITVMENGSALADEDFVLDVNYNNSLEVVLIVYGTLPEQDYYWNGGTGSNPGTPRGQGGSGTWNGGNKNWTNANGDRPNAWVNGKTAIFYNGSGTVNVGSTGISAYGLYFDASGYTLNGNGLSLATNDGSTPQIDVGGSVATIDLVLSAGALTKSGNGRLILTQNNTISGNTQINDGTLQLGAAGMNNGSVGGSISGGGVLELYASGNVDFQNNITGLAGNFNIIAGNVSISNSVNSNRTATTNFQSSGTFTINGALGGTVNINSGTLAGYGTVGSFGSTVSISNAALSPSGMLTIGGSLSISGSSSSNFSLGSGAYVYVNQDLYAGGTINASGSNAGIYTLFTYGGSRTGTFNAGNIPSNSTIDYHDASKQVRLVVLSSNGTIGQYWNGGGSQSVDGLVGGSGVWNNANTNWTDSSGSVASRTAWLNNGTSIAYFAGSQSGTVNVSDLYGQIEIAGMVFQTSGYVLQGDQILLSNASGSNSLTINVTTGTATINAQLTENSGGGSISLVKAGSGTLILGSANSYTGGTTISGGTLQLGSTSGAGSVFGAISGSGALNVFAPSGQSVDFSNDISGLNGPFGINGPGTVNFLKDDSGYSGQTTVSNGTFNVLRDLGGTISVNGGTLAGDNATLGGAGTDLRIGASSASRLSPGDARASGNAYGILTVAGNLILGANATSVFDFSLANQSGASASNDLVVVNGALDLGGSNLTVVVHGNQYGTYTLFSYTGTRSNQFGGTPSITFDGGLLQAGQYQICPQDPDCSPEAGKVYLNIFNAPPGDALYWNGGDSSPGNGVLVGGSGIWKPQSFTEHKTWSDKDDGSDAYPWTDNKTPIFAGETPGTVTIDTEVSTGVYEPIKITGMEFQTDGYLIQGDSNQQLQINKPINISVDENVTGTLDAYLYGTGAITKVGKGKLILNVPNSYGAALDIRDGELQIGTAAQGYSVSMPINIGEEGTLRLTQASSTLTSTLTGTGTFATGLAGTEMSTTYAGDGTGFDGTIIVYNSTNTAFYGGLLYFGAASPGINMETLIVGVKDPENPNALYQASLAIDQTQVTVTDEIIVGDRNDSADGSQGGALYVQGSLKVLGAGPIVVGNEIGSVATLSVTGSTGVMSAEDGDIRIGDANNTNVTVAVGGGGGGLSTGTGDISIGNGDNGTVGVYVQSKGTLSAATGKITLGSDNPTGSGAGTLYIGGYSMSSGINYSYGTVVAQELAFGGGNSKLVFDARELPTDAYDFDVDITAPGGGDNTISALQGFTTYSGDGSAFDGVVDISWSTADTTKSSFSPTVFNVTGTLGGNFRVTEGTLSGTGTISTDGSVVTVGDVAGSPTANLSPGDLSVNVPSTNLPNYGTLTILGNLVLNATANVVFEMSTDDPAGAGGNNDRVAVDGQLTTGGTLTVYITGDYGDYTLITAGNFMDLSTPFDEANSKIYYHGSLTKKFDITYPGSASVVLSVYETPTYTDLYWNGPHLSPTSGVLGGTGIWKVDVDQTNWVSSDGQTVYDWVSPNNAIFMTNSGTVTVDGSGSPQIQVTGMDFKVSGYELVPTTSPSADAITLVLPANPSSNFTAINVEGAITDTASIGVQLRGTAGLETTGTGTLILTADNTYTGGTKITTGKLQLGNAASALNGTVQGDIEVTALGTLAVEVTSTSPFVNDMTGTGNFTVSGPGVLDFSGDSSTFDGDIFVYGGGTLSLSGALAGDHFTIGEDENGGLPSVGSLTLTNNGLLTTRSTIDLTLSSGETAALNIGAAESDAAQAAGNLDVGSISFGPGTATLVFNHTSPLAAPYNFGSGFQASTSTAEVRHIAGTTNFLAGSSNSNFKGKTTISGGVLNLLYDPTGVPHLGGDFVVASGGTLSGTGTVGSGYSTIAVQSGGVIANFGSVTIPPNTSYNSVLDVKGTLELDDGSTVLVYLSPETVNNQFPLFVAAALSVPTTSAGTIHVDVRTLGGSTLGPGYYDLIHYTTLSPGGDLSTFKIVQSNPNYAIDTTIRPGTIFLHVTGGVASDGDYWNPNQSASPSTFGGKGTWTASGGNNWSDAAGTTHGPWDAGVTAIFEGQSGSVTVDTTNGAITVGGLEFNKGPYVLSAKDPSTDVLTLTGPLVFAKVTSATDTVTLDVPLTGTSSGLIKNGAGTLKLTAENHYGNGTTVSAGKLAFGDGGSVDGEIAVSEGAILAVNATGTVTFSSGNVISSSVNTAGTPAAFNIESGTAVLNSDSRGFFGNTNVQSGGTLTGIGKIGGTVTVESGGTLQGSVTNSPPLTAGSALVFEAGSHLAVELNPGTPNTATPLFVTDTLNVKGGEVDISVTAGSTDSLVGDYLLISFTTQAPGSDPSIMTVSPFNPDYFIEVFNKGVYLITNTPDLAYWHPDISVAADFGGDGTWTADTGQNWSDENGVNNGAWTYGTTAVFQGRAGTVRVDSQAESVVVGGMKFLTDGYVITDNGNNDVLTLGGASVFTVIDVGDTDSSVKVEINLPLTGSAGLVKTGDGELVLKTDSTYAGFTQVEAGTLTTGTAGGVPGDIEIQSAATWNFNAGGRSVFDGAISGEGTFNINASGSLNLSGKSNGFTGTTNLNIGTLNITGPANAESSAGLGGVINVANGAVLQGYGTFGKINVVSGGKLQVGVDGGLGKFPVASVQAEGLTLAAGSTIDIAVDLDTNTASKITVSGDVTIGNGVNARVDLSGSPHNAQYPVIVSEGTLNYGSISYRKPYLGYTTGFVKDSGGLVVNFVVQKSQLLDVCGTLTRGSCGVLEAVDGLGEGDELYGNVMSVPKDEGESLLGQLSGDAYASSDAAMISGSRYLRDATGSQVRGSMGRVATGSGVSSVSNYAAAAPVATPFGPFEEDNSGIGVWAAGYGAWSSMDGA